MKGCLVIVGFVVLSAAVVVGVTITVLRVNASKNEPLTQETTQFEYTAYEPETHSSSSGNGRNSVDGANIEYRYRADGRWFASPGSIWLPQSQLSKAVCFDPDDPAMHALRKQGLTCGKNNTGAVRRARAEAS